jgi:hypothetical protein
VGIGGGGRRFTVMPVLFVMRVPALSLIDAVIVAAPTVAPTIIVISAVPLASVRAVPDTGLNLMSNVDEKLITFPARTAPALSLAIALIMAELPGAMDVVEMLGSEDFTMANVIVP